MIKDASSEKSVSYYVAAEKENSTENNNISDR